MKKMTFYAYGKGFWEIVHGGVKSKMKKQEEEPVGHASVFVEGIGTFGFWPTDEENWMNCLGKIKSDQYYVNNQSFEDAHAIFVEDIKAMQASMLISNWKGNPPQYKLGRCDCVSFAMRIADCVGIGYSSITQAPISFISSLRHHEDLMSGKYSDPQVKRMY